MYAAARFLLFRFDPETAHRLVFGLLAASGAVGRSVARVGCGSPDKRLGHRVAGLDFAGPVGLAAGLDKDGALASLWPALGFGAVELGTVTAHPQPGNPGPRLFRFPEERALVNRMGFNNRGSEALATRLGRLRSRGWKPGVPIGVNLGKSKCTPLEEAVEDYATSAQRTAACCDYLVVNVSSPNTPGLRELQNPEHLSDIVRAVVERAGGKPVFVKLAPDLAPEALDAAVDVAEQAGASGLIATNTTIERHGLPDVGAGGLSGAPLHARALEVVRHVAARSSLPVIGVGGIGSPKQVVDMLAAGAEAVQLYTAFIYEGPGLVSRLNRAVLGAMEEAGAEDFSAFLAHLRRGEGA